jgi:sulfopyruvate decarboxylase subunit beta
VKRTAALRIAANAASDLPVVVTCAATSRELAAIADRPNHLYLLDSMGLTSSVGTGVALALEDSSVNRVLVLDGDGSLLMNLGCLATIGYHRPQKLILAILDNASYASTAGLPTYSTRLDLGAIAAACGIQVLRADSEDTLQSILDISLSKPGPHVLHVRIEAGNAVATPLLLLDPVILAARFSTWLNRQQREEAARPVPET